MSHVASSSGTAAFAAAFDEPKRSMLFRPLWGLHVSSIGLGTHLGQNDSYTDRRYEEAIVRAAQLGCNLIDTAFIYRNGMSESAIGRALRRLHRSGIRRDQLVLGTKGGYLSGSRDVAEAEGPVAFGRHCIHPSILERQLGLSLERMGVSAVDFYLLHNCEEQIADLGSERFGSTIRRAFEYLERQVGSRILAYGVSSWLGFRVCQSDPHHLSIEALVRAAEDVASGDHNFRIVQVPINLGMPEAIMTPSRGHGDRARSFVSKCSELGIAVFASTPLCQGQAISAAGNDLQRLYGVRTNAQAALEFVRTMQGVTSAVVGMSSIAHVEENLAVY